MSALTFTLLGELQILRNDQPLTAFATTKARALLIYVAMERQDHSRGSLARLLWPGYSEQSARNNLRQTLFELRQLLRTDETNAPWLLSSRLTIQLNPAIDVIIDAQRFSQLLAASATHDHPQLESCAACLPRLQQAAQLYRGDFLADFLVNDSIEFEEWRCVLQEQLHLQALDLFEALATAAELAGEDRQTQHYVEKQLQLEPWLESAHRRLMRLLWRRGQRGAAIAQYHHLRQILAAELGVAPESLTLALYEQIRTGNSAPDLSESTVKRGALDDEQARPTLLSVSPFNNLNLTNSLPSATIPAMPFVAREREVERLQAVFAQTLTGRGQLFLLKGEAGSGKTTLLRAFAQQAQAANPELIVAGVVCNAYTGVGEPYLPFRNLINLLSGGLDAVGHEGFWTEEQAQRLWAFMPTVVQLLVEYGTALLDSFVPGTTLLARAETFATSQAEWMRKLVARVARTQEIEAQAVTLEQNQLFTQLTELLHQLANQRPLLLILDDLHWMDPSSFNLFFHLGRSLAQSRIFLIGSYRSEVFETDAEPKPHPLLSMVSEFKRWFGDIVLDLDQVTEMRGRHFIDALLDSEPNRLDEQFRQALFHHTEGQALFTVELVRQLQAQGDLLQNEAGEWIEVAALNWANLPARIEGVIEQRINRLPPALRQILQVAGVEGEEFTAEVVARIQGVRERDLVRQLGEILERRYRLVGFVGLTWIGTQRLSRYRFRHNLFQKYLYHNLDEAERAYLHADMVSALESLYADELAYAVVPLAHHCQAAGLFEQAASYYQQAGEQAQRLSAYPEAIDHFRQGLLLLTRLPATSANLQRQLAIQLSLGNILLAVKGYGAPEVAASFQQALALSRQLSESGESIAVLRSLQRAALANGEWQIAREWGEQLLAALDDSVEPGFRAEVHRALAITLFYLGDFVETLNQTDQSIAAYQHQPDYPYLLQFGHHAGVSTYAYRALSLWMLGYQDQAVHQIEQLLHLAHQLEHPFIRATAYGLAASFFNLHRDISSILAQIEIGLKIAQQHHFDYWIGSLLIERGWALVLTAQKSAGMADIEQGLASWRATGRELMNRSEPARHAYMAMLIEVDGLLGHADKALATLADVLAEVKHGAHFFEAELYRLRGELLLLEEGDRAAGQAEQAFEQAIMVAQQQRAKSLELRATVSLCRLWQRLGKRMAARDRLSAIYGWFSEGFDAPDLRAAARLLAELADESCEKPPAD